MSLVGSQGLYFYETCNLSLAQILPARDTYYQPKLSLRWNGKESIAAKQPLYVLGSTFSQGKDRTLVALNFGLEDCLGVLSVVNAIIAIQTYCCVSRGLRGVDDDIAWV